MAGAWLVSIAISRDLKAWSGWRFDATACAASVKIAAQREALVKELNIREMRASLGQLAELVATEGELVIRRRGEPIARVLPMTQQRRPPDHADLRRRMPLLKTGSADLIRGERDEC
nr:type II toxin-antitoxin system Phd/YefM family antitoxin [Cyanobium sp. L1E-Cus]